MKLLTHLFDNNRRWAEQITRRDPGFFDKLSRQQSPEYLWIGCADSRVPANEIVDLLPGELFVHRNVANVVVHTDLNCLSVLQYAVDVLKVKHIIVCGHSDCGAMRAVLNPDSLEKMPTVKAWLRHAEVAKTMVHDNCDCANEGESMKVLTEENVIAQLQHLRTHPSVASRMANGQLFIHGWIYNIETSEIRAFDADQSAFRPLGGEGPSPSATPKARF